MSEKYNPLKDEIFLPIPLNIARRKDIKNKSKLVYGYLLKCYGKDGKINPSMVKIAQDLNISRQHVSKAITELKNAGLIKVFKTGKASQYEFVRIDDVTNVVTTDVTNVVTTDVTNVVTSPLLKEKEKEKIKKSGAAPDFFNDFHPYLDEMMRTMPEILKGQLARPFVNKCLFDKNGDRPYFHWLYDNCADKDNPAAWVAKGMINYYAAYLN